VSIIWIADARIISRYRSIPDDPSANPPLPRSAWDAGRVRGGTGYRPAVMTADVMLFPWLQHQKRDIPSDSDDLFAD